MKRTYQKGGLGVLAMYGVMNVVSSLVMVLCVAVCVGVFVVMNHESLPLLMEALDPKKIDMEFITSFLQLMGVSRFLIFGIVLGAAIGILAGMLVMKKIMGKSTLVPIEKKRLKASEFGIYLLVAFGVWGVGAALGNLSEFFGISIDNPILDNAGDDIIYYYIYAVLGAPVLEELAFRKIFLDRTHMFGETCAAFVSALLFGLFHGNSAQFFLAFGIGLVSAICYQRTGKLIYSILLHFFINLTGTLVELFDLTLHIDIYLAWNISVLCLIIAGILAIIAYRDRPQFTLSLPGTQNANEQVFKNVGMRIAVIGGTVLVGVYDVYMMVMNLVQGKGPWSLISLVPMVANIVMVIVLVKTVGKHVLTPVMPEYFEKPEETEKEAVEAPEPVVMQETVEDVISTEVPEPSEEMETLEVLEGTEGKEEE